MPKLHVTPTFIAVTVVFAVMAARHARTTDVVDTPEVPELSSTPTPDELNAFVQTVNSFEFVREPMAWSWVVAAGFGVALVYALSILAHELGHFLAAKLVGADVTRISLHAAGGFVELADDGRLRRSGFALIVAAGPLVTAILAAAGFALMRLELPDGAPGIVAETLITAALWTNVVALVVNLLPIRGLDGWQLLRTVR